MTVFRLIAVAFVVATLVLSGNVSAQGTGPFGLAIHHSDPVMLVERFPNASDIGINQWSQGPMYEVAGRHLPLEGARRANFIFSRDNRLEGVVIVMNKRRFDAVRGLLDQLYRQTRAQLPFVGDAFVAWREDDVIIELESPHLSFEMTLRYMSTDFVARYEAGRRASAESQRQREAGQL